MTFQCWNNCGKIIHNKVTFGSCDIVINNNIRSKCECDIHPFRSILVSNCGVSNIYCRTARLTNCGVFKWHWSCSPTEHTVCPRVKDVGVVGVNSAKRTCDIDADVGVCYHNIVGADNNRASAHKASRWRTLVGNNLRFIIFNNWFACLFVSFINYTCGSVACKS